MYAQFLFIFTLIAACRYLSLLPLLITSVSFTKRCPAERCYAMISCPSVCLSVRPSVTLVFRDHIRFEYFFK